MSEDDHSSRLNVAIFRIVKIGGYPYLFYLSWLLNPRALEPTSTGLHESEVDPGADGRQRFEQDRVASNGEIMRESKKRKVHLPEFKAKVGPEALRGFKTINESVWRTDTRTSGWHADSSSWWRSSTGIPGACGVGGSAMTWRRCSARTAWKMPCVTMASLQYPTATRGPGSPVMALPG